MKQASVSSADQGGGKRRAEGMERMIGGPAAERTSGHGWGGAGPCEMAGVQGTCGETLEDLRMKLDE
jgi:hypothetical protein